MNLELGFETIVDHLRKIKAEHGDESFHLALKGLFRMVLQKPGAERYIERLLQALSLPKSVDDVKAELQASSPAPASSSPVDVVRQAIEQEMPHCKTQAHFDLVLQAWTALKIYLESCYGFECEKAEQGREALNRLLDLAPLVAKAHAQLQENPEATTNPDYVEPAREMTEHHKQQTLLAELQGIDNLARLNAWYAGSKPALDSIVSQSLRDELFDAIRAKKQALTN